MSGARKIAFVAALVAALALSGCGGDERDAVTGKGGTQPRAESSPSVLARANGNCRRFLRETKKVGAKALSGSQTVPELITERLVKPSVPLLERMARRQQRLARASDDPHLSLYADLFDPIVVLARERLRSGQAALRSGDAEEAQRSEELEDLLTELGLEQMDAARRAGLRDCNVDFRQALLSSVTG